MCGAVHVCAVHVHVRACIYGQRQRPVAPQGRSSATDLRSSVASQWRSWTSPKQQYLSEGSMVYLATPPPFPQLSNITKSSPRIAPMDSFSSRPERSGSCSLSGFDWRSKVPTRPSPPSTPPKAREVDPPASSKKSTSTQLVRAKGMVLESSDWSVAGWPVDLNTSEGNSFAYNASNVDDATLPAMFPSRGIGSSISSQRRSMIFSPQRSSRMKMRS